MINIMINIMIIKCSTTYKSWWLLEVPRLSGAFSFFKFPNFLLDLDKKAISINLYFKMLELHSRITLRNSELLIGFTEPRNQFFLFFYFLLYFVELIFQLQQLLH